MNSNGEQFFIFCLLRLSLYVFVFGFGLLWGFFFVVNGDGNGWLKVAMDVGVKVLNSNTKFVW